MTACVLPRTCAGSIHLEQHAIMDGRTWSIVTHHSHCESRSMRAPIHLMESRKPISCLTCSPFPFVRLNPRQAASEWLYVVPWGLTRTLLWISARYDNPPILITENGQSSALVDCCHRILQGINRSMIETVDNATTITEIASKRLTMTALPFHSILHPQEWTRTTPPSCRMPPAW